MGFHLVLPIQTCNYEGEVQSHVGHFILAHTALGLHVQVASHRSFINVRQTVIYWRQGITVIRREGGTEAGLLLVGLFGEVCDGEQGIAVGIVLQLIVVDLIVFEVAEFG